MAETKAISSYKAYLMYKASEASTYSKLIDIKDFPDLFGAPDALDTTTLSDAQRTYIPGIKDNDSLEFTCNYTKANFDLISGLEGTEQSLEICFGSTEGSDGKYTFSGYVSAGINGAGVNEVVEMTVTIIPTTVITAAAG